MMSLLFIHPDVTRPSFSDNNRCFNGIKLQNNTLPGMSYGQINFEAIGVTDNSGGPIVVVSDPPGNELGHPYNFQITTQTLPVSFTASDPSGNIRVCRFLTDIFGRYFRTYHHVPIVLFLYYMFRVRCNWMCLASLQVSFTASDPSGSKCVCRFLVDIFGTYFCTFYHVPMVLFLCHMFRVGCNWMCLASLQVSFTASDPSGKQTCLSIPSRYFWYLFLYFPSYNYSSVLKLISPHPACTTCFG